MASERVEKSFLDNMFNPVKVGANASKCVN